MKEPKARILKKGEKKKNIYFVNRKAWNQANFIDVQSACRLWRMERSGKVACHCPFGPILTFVELWSLRLLRSLRSWQSKYSDWFFMILEIYQFLICMQQKNKHKAKSFGDTTVHQLWGWWTPQKNKRLFDLPPLCGKTRWNKSENFQTQLTQKLWKH